MNSNYAIDKNVTITVSLYQMTNKNSTHVCGPICKSLCMETFWKKVFFQRGRKICRKIYNRILLLKNSIYVHICLHKRIEKFKRNPHGLLPVTSIRMKSLYKGREEKTFWWYCAILTNFYHSMRQLVLDHGDSTHLDKLIKEEDYCENSGKYHL